MFKTFWISLVSTHKTQCETNNDLKQSILKQTMAAGAHVAQPPLYQWWGIWLGKLKVISYATLNSIIFQTEDTCLAEGVGNQMPIPVTLSTVTAVSSLLHSWFSKRKGGGGERGLQRLVYRHSTNVSLTVLLIRQIKHFAIAFPPLLLLGGNNLARSH